MNNPVRGADTEVRPYKNLLVEIGCEELPPKNLQKLQEAFVEYFKKMLNAANLSFTNAEGFITPRRLAIRINDLSVKQPDHYVTKRGPAKNAAFDETGKPTKAALGFAASCNISIDALSLQETDKGAWLVFEKNEPGKTAEELIPHLLTETLHHLPMGRRMRWGSRTDSFARPVHWIVLLLDHKVIQTEIFGIKSSNLTYGHRFHHPASLPISDPKEYESILENNGFVIANFEKRRKKIMDAITTIETEKKCHAIVEEALLDEVTGLVEWPIVLHGSFDKAFLDIPSEVLITSMQTHQRCFPLTDQQQKLLPHFLLVSNIQSKKTEEVIRGNERVIAARLNDAVFYYRVDKEISLAQRSLDLKKVRFQQKLGTLWDKSQRIAAMAEELASQVNANPVYTKRAALLCKADLLTQMVGEFPELQSIMGYYYALNDGEPVAVAKAIAEHVYPRFAQDTLPTTPEGIALALADRLDSLIGIFGLSNRPTGDKDPFALRRQALGILRILIEKQCDYDLKELLETAVYYYAAGSPTRGSDLNQLFFIDAQEAILSSKTNLVSELLNFCFERLKILYHNQGINPRVFEAVYVKRITNPLDFDRRIKALYHFITLTDSEGLTASNKRVKNILSKCDRTILKNTSIDPDLLKESAEKTLWLCLSEKKEVIPPLLQAKDYTEALKFLATLREPIDQFFTDVMVMADDLDLRHNRLRLLYRLRQLFLEIADISLL